MYFLFYFLFPQTKKGDRGRKPTWVERKAVFMVAGKKAIHLKHIKQHESNLEEGFKVWTTDVPWHSAGFTAVPGIGDTHQLQICQLFPPSCHVQWDHSSVQDLAEPDPGSKMRCRRKVSWRAHPSRASLDLSHIFTSFSIRVKTLFISLLAAPDIFFPASHSTPGFRKRRSCKSVLWHYL